MSKAPMGGEIDKCDPSDCATCGSDCGGIDLSEKIIQLTTDDGEKMPCLVVLKYSMGLKRYAAVMPIIGNPEADIYLYRMVRNDKDLENIEDDDEYAKAAETFGIEMEKAQNARQAAEAAGKNPEA